MKEMKRQPFQDGDGDHDAIADAGGDDDGAARDDLEGEGDGSSGSDADENESNDGAEDDGAEDADAETSESDDEKTLILGGSPVMEDKDLDGEPLSEDSESDDSKDDEPAAASGSNGDKGESVCLIFGAGKMCDGRCLPCADALKELTTPPTKRIRVGDPASVEKVSKPADAPWPQFECVVWYTDNKMNKAFETQHQISLPCSNATSKYFNTAGFTPRTVMNSWV